MGFAIVSAGSQRHNIIQNSFMFAHVYFIQSVKHHVNVLKIGQQFLKKASEGSRRRRATFGDVFVVDVDRQVIIRSKKLSSEGSQYVRWRVISRATVVAEEEQDGYLRVDP